MVLITAGVKRMPSQASIIGPLSGSQTQPGSHLSGVPRLSGPRRYRELPLSSGPEKLGEAAHPAAAGGQQPPSLASAWVEEEHVRRKQRKKRKLLTWRPGLPTGP